MKFLILVGALLTASFFSQAQASDWSIAAELKEPSSITINFQESTAISRDGKTVLIAATAESCSAGRACGAIYVYVKGSSGWRRQAKLVASDAVAGLLLGGEGYDDNAIALSGDGNTAFVGSYPRFPGSGAVYIFVRKGGLWTEC